MRPKARDSSERSSKGAAYSAGNVWASGPGGIRIITPEGKVLGQLKSPDKAQANLAWGGPDLKTAYIMAAGNVYKLKMQIPGEKPLYTN